MKKVLCALTAIMIILAVNSTTFAASGTWIQDWYGWWYQYDNGSYPVDQWADINGEWFYFDSYGYMKTGWLYYGNNWYYLSGYGTPVVGWLYDGYNWYYLSDSATMVTGWLQYGGNWYYLNSSGAMVTGTQMIDGKTYSFSSGGALIDSSQTSNNNYNYNYQIEEARNVLYYINAFRTGSEAWYWNPDNASKTWCYGLENLEYSYELEQVAMLRAAELVSYQSHDRPNGEHYPTAYNDVGCTLIAYSECWACRFYTGMVGYYSASEVENDFEENNEYYDGQSHRRSLLSNAKYVGAAYIIDGSNHYWVLEFGSDVYY